MPLPKIFVVKDGLRNKLEKSLGRFAVYLPVTSFGIEEILRVIRFIVSEYEYMKDTSIEFIAEQDARLERLAKAIIKYREDKDVEPYSVEDILKEFRDE